MLMSSHQENSIWWIKFSKPTFHGFERPCRRKGEQAFMVKESKKEWRTKLTPWLMSPRMRQSTTMMRTRRIILADCSEKKNWLLLFRLGFGKVPYPTFRRPKFIIFYEFRRCHLPFKCWFSPISKHKKLRLGSYIHQSSEIMTFRLRAFDALPPSTQMLLWDHFSLLQSTSPHSANVSPRKFQPLLVRRW